MQHTLHALIAVLVLGTYATGTARAESGARWWPFGRGEAAEPPAATAQEQPATEHATGSGPEQHWMINSSRGKVSWPRFHMPELPKPSLPPLWPPRAEVDASRNAWTEENPTAPQPSPMQTVKDGARRIGDSTKAAWDKTVDAFTPRSEQAGPAARVASRDTQLPWWKRAFGAEEQPQGPQTVTEWMAQDRLDP